jgi:branched-subunit amino acid aminotransferase/4-amino-4-deoxychorismate lyase
VTGELLAADSWLAEDGRVRAYGRHRDRFRAACSIRGPVAGDEVERFLADCAERVPAAGRWFPRVELRRSGLNFLLRPAPDRRTEIAVWIDPAPDRRTVPAVKGPDLELLAGRREAAVRAGADEAVLLASDGTVLEGSTTSLLWWRGDTLCAPPPGTTILAGVTRSLILARARHTRIPVRYERCRPADLSGLEVWAVNALHGIRPVTAWRRSAVVAGPAHRAPAWDAWLTSLPDDERCEQR